MNPSTLLASPVFVVLFKWTCLLALGWGANWALRHRHARWRLILWRSLLCFGLALPLVQCFHLPGIKIPIAPADTYSITPGRELPTSPVKTVNHPPTTAATTPVANTMTAPAPVTATVNSIPTQVPAKPVSWTILLFTLWALGCAWGMFRLLRLTRQLSRLRENACAPRSEIQQMAAQTRSRLEVHQEIAVKLSDEVSSPFLCGLLKPMVILPRKLAQQLSLGEIAALLSHEIAHVRQHDLRWCVAWRWMQVVCWFHPLVWKIPAAHNLACEQEADRIASGQLPDQQGYAQMLARLALQVLALSPVETQLSVNGGSQIAQRLNHLARTGIGTWNWRHSMAGFALVTLLFLLTIGCEFSKTSPDQSTSAKLKFAKVLVVVQDEDGKPIAGATVSPFAFRVKGRHYADANGWNTNLFGPREKVLTDAEGRAYVGYPVEGIPSEKEFTAALCFEVTHPDYSTGTKQEYAVDKPEAPIRLTRGIPLEVSGFFGSDREPVTDLVPMLTDGTPPEDWQKEENGHYINRKLSPGGHLLQLMGRLPNGEIVFSDTLAITTERGSQGQLYLIFKSQTKSKGRGVIELSGTDAQLDGDHGILRYRGDQNKGLQVNFEMKPGIRLEGRLDDSVPRPVKDGRVMLDVRPEQYTALNVIEDYYDQDATNGGRYFWHSYRPINADGTFVFESVPPGIADMVVLGDGFASKTIGQLQNRVNGKLVEGPVMAIPHAFPLTTPVTKVEIATEPTATLEFTATTQAGKPIEGVWAGMYPSVFRMRGMFGWKKDSSEMPYRDIPRLPDLDFSGKTDKNGQLVIQNLPPETKGMEIYHPQYQPPLQDLKGWRDRHIRITFAPGVTNQFKLALEPKGADFIGDR